MDPMFISLLAFLAVTILVVAVGSIMRDLNATSVEDRLEIITGKKVREEDNEGVLKEEMLRESVGGMFGLLSGLTKRLSNLKMFFEQADCPIRPEAVLAMSIVFAVFGVLAAMVAGSPIPLYPVVGLTASSLPFGWLWWRRRSRFKAFAVQLPDALELIGRALRSGYSLPQGMHVVVEEMPSPLSLEFSRAYEEQNLGVPIDIALKSMVKRMPNMDLKFFATAVAIQRQAGGDMAEILDKISYIVRERFKILGQVKALTGEGRLSGVVLMALPVALFFAVYHLNPDYVMLLFKKDLGRQMIGVAAVLQILGAVVIKKIVNIKV